MRTEPFIYGVEEVKAYNGHLDPNQAVACENVPVIGMLEDNKALATEGEFLPEPETDEAENEEPAAPEVNEEPVTPEDPEPVVEEPVVPEEPSDPVVEEPTEPATNEEPTVEP